MRGSISAIAFVLVFAVLPNVTLGTPSTVILTVEGMT
jgi:hypothetical protein